MAPRAQAAQALFLVLMVAGAQGCWAACKPPESLARQLQTTPGAAAYAALGAWHAERRQFACAAEVFGKASALEPSSFRYQYLFGLSLVEDGRPHDALAPLARALQLDSTSTQAHLSLGAALDQTGDRRAAELEWRLALAQDGESLLALENLSGDLLADHRSGAVIALLEPLQRSAKWTDTLALHLAAAYSSSGLPQQAESLLRTRLEASPASLPIAEALSGVLMLESRFQDAVAVLSPIAAQNPSDLHARILLLQTLVLAHNPGAESLGQRLIVSAPTQWELLYFMGLLHQQQDDLPGARDYFRRSIAARPGEADTHYRLGVVLGSLKDNTAARAELEKAMALGLDTPELHFALARALQSLGETAPAQQQLDLYRQRLQAQSARAQAADKAQQGDQAAAAGDPRQTVDDYRAALALDPHEPVLAYKLAMACAKTGDRSGERTALEQALALDPHMAEAHNQLGYLDAAEGNTEAAISHFQRAVDADPAFSKAWLNLAASLCLEAKWDQARAALSHVLSLGIDAGGARALLQQIDRMQAQPRQ